MISIEQFEMIIQLLANASKRLDAIDADLVISRKNDLFVADQLNKINAEIHNMQQCFIDNDMATRDPLVLVTGSEVKEPVASATVYHLTKKELV